MPDLIVTVSCDDPSDLQWLRDRVSGAVDEVLEDNRDRFDGEVTMSVEENDGEA